MKVLESTWIIKTITLGIEHLSIWRLRELGGVGGKSIG
jgi:hypothetical protein